jgi:biotin-(acetyl-CoA carboxylase) ligase
MLGSGSLWSAAGVLEERAEVLLKSRSNLSNHPAPLHSTRQFLVNDFRSYFYCDVDQFLAFKNRTVEIELGPHSIVTGKFIGIDTEGCIILEVDGKFWKIEHGKILRVLTED